MTYYADVKFLDSCNAPLIERNAAEFKRMCTLLHSVRPSVKKANELHWTSDHRPQFDARLKDVEGLVNGLYAGFELAYHALLEYADAVELAQGHLKAGQEASRLLAGVIARKGTAVTREAQKAEPMRQWEDLRATTGFLDFLAELTVDVDDIRDEANRLHDQASEAFTRARDVELEARRTCVLNLKTAREAVPDFRVTYPDARALMERVDALVAAEVAEAGADPNVRLPGSGPKSDVIPMTGPNVVVSAQLARINALCDGLPPGVNNSYWHTTTSDQDRQEWIKANSTIIAAAARQSGLPPDMLAGIAWQEVGGKGRVWDDLAGAGRYVADQPWFPVIPENLPGRLGGAPDTTSYGPLSIQVRRAAEVLGYNPATLSDDQRHEVVRALQNPATNIFIASGYLAQLKAESPFADVPADRMTPAQYQELAARYNGGPYYAGGDAQAYGRGFMNDLDRAREAMK
ncbi:hypothetical protein ABTX81_35200 [Kitasatospora sp. NPDC097605]|uniref:hypothetical protein n=1 Tax=Kitasatospora sp. NPDC097605 TaxID=3157226 RepID=UPI00332EB46F